MAKKPYFTGVLLARPRELESPAFCSGGRRSIQLSYGRLFQCTERRIAYYSPLYNTRRIAHTTDIHGTSLFFLVVILLSLC